MRPAFAIAGVIAASIVGVVAPSTTVHADDGPPADGPLDGPPLDGPPLDASSDDLAVHESGSLFHDPGEPLLTIDIVPRPNVVGLGVTEDTHRTAIKLGKHAMLIATGTSWKGYADAVPTDRVPEADVARGSRAAIGFRYDFGWLQLDAELSQNVLSSRYGSGRYRDISLTISKSHKFSRWVTGWISLSIGNRTWVDDAPDGEENSTTVMLGLGLTFR